MAHAHRLGIGDDGTAGADKLRQQHLGGVVFGVIRAAELAEARADAAVAVMRQAASGPAQRLRALQQQLVVVVVARWRHGADAEQCLGFVKKRVPHRHRQLRQLAFTGPARQQPAVDAFAQVEVVQRRAADALALVQVGGAVDRGAAASLPVELRQHQFFALRHRCRRQKGARLEHDDRQASLSEHPCRGHATGAAADDADIATQA
jgi:hypothetical protein